jgi:YVTN family beta-propeller protein
MRTIQPIAAALLVAGCVSSRNAATPENLDGQHRLPTGAYLDPAGAVSDLGPYPFAMIHVSDPDRAVVLLAGYRDNGVQIVDPASGKVLQTLPQRAAFAGLAYDSTRHRIYASGGNRDLVYVYDWTDGTATMRDSLVLQPRTARQDGIRYPAGIALSPDGATLYAAENLDDSLAVVDVASGHVRQRVGAGRYPYAVVVAPDGDVYASAWGAFEVRRWRVDGDHLQLVATMRVARHPSALLLNRDASRLFVASASTDRVRVIDTHDNTPVGELVDTIPNSAGEGSTPTALLLSPDGAQLFVAESDNNAVASFALDSATAGLPSAYAANQLLGRIPVDWYPSGLAWQHDTLLVVNAKGRGTGANATNGPGPGAQPPRVPTTQGYTLGQLTGTLATIPMAGVPYAAMSRRVAHANGWDRNLEHGAYPPFTHVIYIIKENRTYDQVFGDLTQADGDTSLVFFGRNVSPNHHALAERFGIFDRFFVNAEVSADGHNWSTAAYTTDYVQKTVPLNYGGGGRTYDFEGENRDVRPPAGEDAAEPANGYLWDLARKRGITFRNFGEFVADPDRAALSKGYQGLKPFLDSHTDSAYAGFDLGITDQSRADEWITSLHGWEQSGAMPTLQTIHLPNDHTRGATAGAFTPRAYMADNDLALGRMIEALSTSPFWKNTVVFVLEDDAQNGPDHVDSHRSPMMIISAYNQPHVWHRFGNTTDVIATIEEILSLDHLSQFDGWGRPYRGVFSTRPDLTPYHALTPAISLTERNPRNTPAARASAGMDFRLEDLVDDDAFNHVLWLAIKGNAPYPAIHHMTAPR